MINEGIKELAKELCKKSCHHICEDTTDCVIEDEAKEVIANSATTTEKQIEEMIEIVKPFVSGLACEEESGSCELTDCRNCNARNLSNKLYNAGYRKQSEGEWKYQFTLDGDRFYECSVCGRQVVINCLCNKKRNASEFYPYCHCGAKMKGGEE